MKKLGNGKGLRVHPAPPPEEALRDHLAALPAATLAAVEQEVLVYLLSGGGEMWREQRRWRRRAHPAQLGCRCFWCYKSFWVRWDASPNRHVIHFIIDAVEESLASREQGRGGGGHRRRHSGRGGRKGADLAAAEDYLGEEVKGLLALDGRHLADDGGVGYDNDGSSVEDERKTGMMTMVEKKWLPAL
ncbi:hypothetical protein MUK42_24257 [Musa troglodytarum]|uniref:Uncharacterized protein n=1 Tax=Musa troglodytarum TaxID=320322 RepID=A0A9E7J9G5_9LILI|nr:hypothetical protein MUK42_24257 [Musa troglodytarum]